MKNYEVLGTISYKGNLLGVGSVITLEDDDPAVGSLLKRNLVRVTEADKKIIAPAKRKIKIHYQTTDEKYIAGQDELLQKLAIELESGKATNEITGQVAIHNYYCIVTWVLRQLGWTGGALEQMRSSVNYKSHPNAPEWRYLKDSYIAKASLDGISQTEAKAKFIATVDKGYVMIAKLNDIFDKNEEAKKQKASKNEAQKESNKNWRD